MSWSVKDCCRLQSISKICRSPAGEAFGKRARQMLRFALFPGDFVVQMVAGPVDEGRSNLHRAGLCKGKQWMVESLRFFSRLGWWSKLTAALYFRWVETCWNQQPDGSDWWDFLETLGCLDVAWGYTYSSWLVPQSYCMIHVHAVSLCASTPICPNRSQIPMFATKTKFPCLPFKYPLFSLLLAIPLNTFLCYFNIRAMSMPMFASQPACLQAQCMPLKHAGPLGKQHHMCAISILMCFFFPELTGNALKVRWKKQMFPLRSFKSLLNQFISIQTIFGWWTLPCFLV